MQTVRFNSTWGYRSPGDVVTLPVRDAFRLRDIGVVEFTESAATRYADAPLVRRSLDMAPKSLDTKERTIEALIATDTPVFRDNLRHGAFNEVLLCGPQNVDLHRMNRGAPLMDSHQYDDGVQKILGSVVPGSAKAAGRGVVAKLKFSRSEEGERAFQDAKDGVLRSLSVGYLVHQRDIDETTQPPTHRISAWTPFEVSAVAIPADAASGFL